MIRVVRIIGTDSYVLADGKSNRFHPITEPSSNPTKARRKLRRMRSLMKEGKAH